MRYLGNTCEDRDERKEEKTDYYSTPRQTLTLATANPFSDTGFAAAFRTTQMPLPWQRTNGNAARLDLEACTWDTEARRRSTVRVETRKNVEQVEGEAGIHGVPPPQAQHSVLQIAPEPPPQTAARPAGSRRRQAPRLRTGAGRGPGPPQPPAA
jgi:hypothetical protein